MGIYIVILFDVDVASLKKIMCHKNNFELLKIGESFLIGRCRPVAISRRCSARAFPEELPPLSLPVIDINMGTESIHSTLCVGLKLFTPLVPPPMRFHRRQLAPAKAWPPACDPWLGGTCLSTTSSPYRTQGQL